MSQTNIIVDGQPESNLIRAMLDYVEKKMAEDPSFKLKKALAKWIDAKGLESCNWVTVKNQLLPDIERKLQQQKIPYLLMPTEGGTGIITRVPDKEAFTAVLRDVMSMTPEFYAATSTSQMAKLIKTEDISEMVKLHVGSQYMAEQLIARLNQDGRGIVGTVCEVDDPDSPNGKSYDILIRPEDAIKMNGHGLSEVEIQFALNEVTDDHAMQNFRLDQAAYDTNELQIMLSELGKGNSVAIVDMTNSSNICIRLTPDRMVVERRDKNGYWNEIREFPEKDGSDFHMPILDPNDRNFRTPENQAMFAQFTNTVRAAAKDIRNMRVIPARELITHQAKSASKAAEDIANINKDNLPWAYGANTDNTGMLKQSLDPNRPLRPDIYSNVVISQEQRAEHEWYKTKGTAMIDAVNQEAHRRALAIPNYQTMAANKQHEYEKQIVIRVLEEKSLPAIQEYLLDGKHDATYQNLIAAYEDNYEQNGLQVDFIAASQFDKYVGKDYVLKPTIYDAPEKSYEQYSEAEKVAIELILYEEPKALTKADWDKINSYDEPLRSQTAHVWTHRTQAENAVYLKAIEKLAQEKDGYDNLSMMPILEKKKQILEYASAIIEDENLRPVELKALMGAPLNSRTGEKECDRILDNVKRELAEVTAEIDMTVSQDGPERNM